MKITLYFLGKCAHKSLGDKFRALIDLRKEGETSHLLFAFVVTASADVRSSVCHERVIHPEGETPLWSHQQDIFGKSI
jgi:hypothetical protein